MKSKKINLVNILTLLIVIQPFFDIFVYFINNNFEFNLSVISFVRPIISIVTYIILLFNYNISKNKKKYSFIYLCMYITFCLLHLINIKNNFFDLSYGSISNEIRFLCNFGYFLLQFINFNFIFTIIDNKEKKKILLSVVYAINIMALLYFTAVLTHTSPKTYIYSTGKLGWKGWSVSSHYIGHSIMYSLPVIIYTLFEKNYLDKFKYIIILLIIIPAYYMVGTKTPLFAVLIIILFYTFLRIVDLIKNKRTDKDTVFFIILSLVLVFTLKYTYGFDNFKNQIDIYNGDGEGQINLIEDNLKDNGKLAKYNTDKNVTLVNFEDRMIYTIYKYRDIKASVFDNRTIQKILNKYLRSISPLSDKLLGYGHSNMPNCTWVETDFLTVFYCYGIVGFILIILIPFGFVCIKGLKCLIDIKKMTRSKFLLGCGLAVSIFALYYVGYTMQFAQTVFYLIILLNVATIVFDEENVKKETKDYLFAINDLNIGGAEVGMVDVVNELVNKGNKVDIVLLRKRGPLLDKLDKNVNVYEILNSSYSEIKEKIYYIMYMLGGPFIKYVYKKTIKNKYKNEIAYLEGYPAVFVAASNNPDSNKIASIRVGLKNHKLKASKLPWGEYEVKKAYKKMDSIYTVSNLTTEEFLEKYPFCKNKTRTIYTYFNVEEIKKKSKEKYNYKYDRNKINFLAVGRFNEQKSYDRLIEAFYQVQKKNKNVLLHFLGNYNTIEGEKIISLIKEKEIEDKVIIHGIIENPYPYIKDCDCLISSSLYEGFPRVINEAISLDKICIGTNVTGTKEALQDGKLGLLVENSIEGLIEGMNKFINNPNIYEEYKDEINKFDGNKEHYFKNLEDLTHKKKNMIIYMPKLSFGGMEKALVNLINYSKLNEKYNLTLYLVYKGEMNYIHLLPKNMQLIVACQGNFNTFGKLEAIFKLMFRYIYHIFNKYDIAISYSYQHPVLCSLTRLSSQNNIIYIHGNLEDGMDPEILKKRLKKCKYEKFKKIICVSNNAKDTLIKLINRKDDIYVLNNLIDGDNIIAKANEKVKGFEFKKNKIYFINIARHFEQYKKIIRIIEAVNKLNQEGYEFEVLLIGDGEDHKLYEEKIKEYNIKNIHLLGKKKNPYKYLKHSSALLLSSIREGYPVVFIEAMVLNKPIVTTNVSDAEKDIKGKFGIVVDNNDKAIYTGMKEFIENGYKIKDKFNYIKFNEEIENKIEKIFND